MLSPQSLALYNFQFPLKISISLQIKSAEYLLSLKNFSLTSISPSSHHSFIPLLPLIKLLKDFVCFPIFTLKVKVTHLCLPLCDPMDYKVHGILQARILE